MSGCLLRLTVLLATGPSRDSLRLRVRVASVCRSPRVSLCEGRCEIVSVNEVNMSVNEADMEVLRRMRPSFIDQMSDAEHEEFMRLVESEPVADERLARLFERPSPFGQHIDV